MVRWGIWAAVLGACMGIAAHSAKRPAPVDILYPPPGAVFPPDIAPPAFTWTDTRATAWVIEAAGKRVAARGEPPQIGEIDPRCIAPSNDVPKLSAKEAAAHTWVPDAETWEAIKHASSGRPLTITITGFRDASMREAVSRGAVNVTTSKDPAGAPIFYRDVPLMPSETEKGVIKPLAENMTPLIRWRLRNIAEPGSRTLLENMPTCANCHSFSADGKALAMDLDGPQNDKGLYAIARIAPETSIRNEDVISWSGLDAQPAGAMRVGFMSQISPDGRYIITTIAGRTEDIGRNYYVANFKDYRFLQVFYATRGILVYYDRLTGHRRPLHGADDPRYVQTNAVWSPDGHYLVFARAEARDAYPPGRALALFANDPRETRIQYDLYRIPFNGGEGGAAEPIPGASHNDMSNSFPKISPDGRWMVFVQSRNGSLMRPDSRLFIVPAAGGSAREMKANLPVMNSWHSFSPSGRWMVFSSKARSPFTQMYLTHIDDDGNDTPAIRIENATAANRAVNIPEFVNIRPEAWLKIDVPAVEFYHRVNRAWELSLKGDYRQAVSAWEQALQLSPGDVKARNNLAVALSREGRLEEAIGHWEKALAANPAHAEVRRNLGEAHSRLASALLAGGKVNGAVAEFRKSVEADPRNAALQNDLGVALLRQGSTADAEAHFRKALETDGAFTRARHNLGNALYLSGNVPEALVEWEDVARREPRNAAVLNQIAWVRATAGDASVRRGGAALELAARAVEASNGRDARYLDTLAAAYAECGRYAEAVATAQQALTLAAAGDETLAAGLRRRLGLYRSGKPFRQGME